MSTAEKVRHTPGPWKVKAAEFKGNGVVAYEIIMPRAEISMSNADLIAAAPELLSLLTEGREWYPSEMGTGRGAKWRERVEAAIRKAKGEL